MATLSKSHQESLGPQVSHELWQVAQLDEAAQLDQVGLVHPGIDISWTREVAAPGGFDSSWCRGSC